MLRKAGAVAAALGLTAASLQGCGGKSSSKGGSTITSTSTATTTATTTSSEKGPVGPQEPQAFVPVRGILYEAKPKPDKAMTLPPGADMMQEAYKPQFHTVRDDLGVMRMMGASSVRLSAGLGSETSSDHSKFLDRAHDLGLNVIVDFLSPSSCPDFDCSAQWEKVAGNALTKQGFAKDKKWHPALKMIVLMDKPDALSVMDRGRQVPCLAASPDGQPTEAEQAVCRTRIVLSCLDGLLQAEAKAGIDGSEVKLGVSWTFVTGHVSLDGSDNKELYGFQDVKVGIANPSKADYKFKTEDYETAYKARWVHSIGLVASWDYAVERVIKMYDPFKEQKLLISSWAMLPDSTDSLVESLAKIEAQTKETDFFLGVVYDSFQTDYSQAVPSVKLFSLGEATMGDDMNICDMDPFRPDPPTCNMFKLHCLDASTGEHSADVAKAWGGDLSSGVGFCEAERVDITV